MALASIKITSYWSFFSNEFEILYVCIPFPKNSLTFLSWYRYIFDFQIVWNSSKVGAPSFWVDIPNGLKFFPVLCTTCLSCHFQMAWNSSKVIFQGASSGRSAGGLRLNCLWTSSALGAGKGLFKPRMHQAPISSKVCALHFWVDITRCDFQMVWNSGPQVKSNPQE